MAYYEIDDILVSGRYAGKTFRNVIEIDLDYVNDIRYNKKLKLSPTLAQEIKDRAEETHRIAYEKRNKNKKWASGVTYSEPLLTIPFDYY